MRRLSQTVHQTLKRTAIAAGCATSGKCGRHPDHPGGTAAIFNASVHGRIVRRHIQEASPNRGASQQRRFISSPRPREEPKVTTPAMRDTVSPRSCRVIRAAAHSLCGCIPEQRLCPNALRLWRDVIRTHCASLLHGERAAYDQACRAFDAHYQAAPRRAREWARVRCFTLARRPASGLSGGE